MTEPGTPSDVPDADRAEQEALLDPTGVASAGDADGPGVGVPEADALEQQLAARPGDELLVERVRLGHVGGRRLGVPGNRHLGRVDRRFLLGAVGVGHVARGGGLGHVVLPGWLRVAVHPAAPHPFGQTGSDPRDRKASGMHNRR